MLRRHLIYLAAAVVLAPAAGASPFSESYPLELEYRARKLFFSAVTTARLELVAPASLRDVLRTPPEGSPIASPPEAVMLVTVETRLPFGRREAMRLLLDPRTGAALQSDRTVRGRRTARVVSRFTKEGIYSWRWSPADRRQERLPPEAWTELHEGFSPYPRELPAGALVTEAYAVIPLTLAARFEGAVDGREIVVPSYHGLLLLALEPRGLERRPFEIEGIDSARRSERLLRLVRVSTRAVAGSGRESAHELGVLGFEGGLTILVDVATGVPCALTGHVPYLGSLTARLVGVRHPSVGQPASP